MIDSAEAAAAAGSAEVAVASSAEAGVTLVAVGAAAVAGGAAGATAVLGGIGVGAATPYSTLLVLLNDSPALEADSVGKRDA